MPSPATTKASTGAISAGTKTLLTSPPLTRACVPWAASAAPTTPPIRACDELDGRPYHQVIRFHVIAPIGPANTIVGVIMSGLHDPLRDVAATSSGDERPHEVQQRRPSTAVRGGIGAVEMPVATTFAVHGSRS